MLPALTVAPQAILLKCCTLSFARARGVSAIIIVPRGT